MNVPLPYDFEIGVLLKEAWKRVAGTKFIYWQSFLIYIVGYFVTALALQLIQYITPTFFADPSIKNSALLIIFNLQMFAFYPLLIGVLYIGVLRANDRPAQLAVIFKPYRRMFHLWGTFILTSLISAVVIFVDVAIRALLTEMLNTHPVLQSLSDLIIIVISITAILFFNYVFMFAPLLVFTKRMGILQAMKASLLGVFQHWVKISILLSVVMAIVFVSALPLFIGYIWSIPLSFNVMGILYKTIFGAEK